VLTGLPVAAASMALGVIAIGTFVKVPALALYLAMAAIAAALVRVAFTARELRQANDAFRQARTDDLTHLLNRRGFTDEVDKRLTGTDATSGMLLVDLDGFKEVNDSLGHHAGDQLLVIVAERFTRAAPHGALVARLGGDEFGIAVAGDRDATQATAVALLAALADPIGLDDMVIRVGASIGLAHTTDTSSGRSELLRTADVAMYDAKTNHLGYAWYAAANDPHSRDRLALIEDLRTAIAERSFEMHYGMEALIRWNHPTRGMLPPDQFIPLAERVGLIPAITHAVLDLSIAHLANTRRDGHQLRLSVNISAKDLVDDDLPRYIRATLDAHHVPPSVLTLEITETALSIDSVRAARILSALRAEGIRISIDDFGVGYSSMSQLLNLPLDELKLDRRFIANLAIDVRARAILSATVELGRTLGLDIVAEGIETADALATVTTRGVDTAQGYYLSRPLSSSAFNTYIANHQPDPTTSTELSRPS
jgi:diguanylate cyclase